MKFVLLFTLIGAAIAIAAYYLLVRVYYWGPKGPPQEKGRSGEDEDTGI